MLNVGGIQAFLISVAGLLVIVVGVSIVMKSRKAQMSEVAQTSGITLVGMAFIVIGATAGLVVALGGDLVKLVTGK